MVNKGHCKNARHHKQNYRMKAVTNYGGKSQGSTQTILNPVRIFFFYFFPLQIKVFNYKK